jgi:hypothetical protein
VDGDRWDEQVGSVAEEAQRLLESLRRAGGDVDDESAGDTDGGDSVHAEPADGRADPAGEQWVCTDPFCRSCPLCRTVAVVRGLSPETLGRLADLATVAAGVLSDLARDRAGAPADTGDRPVPEEPTAARTRPAPARPIPVRDADEDSARG